MNGKRTGAAGAGADARFSRVETVDALRGLAALSVAWFHFTNGQPRFLADGWLKAIGSLGWLGVPVFFVISGFVLPVSMHARGYRLNRDAVRFMARRVVRLDPPYFVAALLAWALWELSAASPWFAGEQPHITTAQVLAHVGYLNGWLGLEWLNPVFWTLAIEFQFYLTLALLFPLIAHENAMMALATILGLGLASLVVREPVFVISHFSLFGLGLLCFQWRAARISLSAMTIAFPLMLLCTHLTQGLQPMLAAGVAALIIVRGREWRWPLLTWLGGISYSLYLTHVPIGGRVVNFGMRLPDDRAVEIVALCLAVAASLAAASLLHRYVEQPAQRWAAAIRYPALRGVGRAGLGQATFETEPQAIAD